MHAGSRGYFSAYITNMDLFIATAMFVLLNVAQYFQPSAACPKECTCLTNGYVNCSSRGLTSVPDGIPPNTTILDLSGNTFSSIPDTAFNLTELQVLNLGKCGIRELPPNLFKGLANLRALNLQENRIETLKRDTFAGITFVPEYRRMCFLGKEDRQCILDLRKNPIKSIKAGAFRSTLHPRIYIGDEPTTTLTIENRAFESLKRANIVITNVADLVFETSAFEGCFEPRIIRIVDSGMDTLSHKAFGGITRVTYVEIDNCTIGEFPKALFLGTTFQGRDNYVAENAISIRRSTIKTVIPYMAFAGTDVRSISITENTMHGFANFTFYGMKLYSLNIAMNTFTHQDSLRPYKLSGIQEALLGIFIQNNSFNVIDKDAFTASKNINRLKITGHSENFTVSAFAFRDLSKVKELEFDNMGSLLLEKNSLSGIDITRIRFYESTITDFDRNAINTCVPGFASLSMYSGPIPCDCFAAGLAYFCRFKNIGYFISCRDGMNSRSVTAFGSTAEWHGPNPALPKCTASSALTCPGGGASLKSVSPFLIAVLIVMLLFTF
ncbi:slit homolog 1 protein-like isoform X2 [Lineus longissimus]|uniref:slit homolog 1 protein-like isoform X2 n=1 Tax=Lineus longissimus TaxID=88925 RepID=UPI002B4C392A